MAGRAVNATATQHGSCRRHRFPLLFLLSGSYNTCFKTHPQSSFIYEPQSAFIRLLKCAASQRLAPKKIGALHCAALKDGFFQNRQVGNGLLNLYLKVGFLEHAHMLFEEISERDTLTWTLLITGYARIGKYGMGLDLFSAMLIERVLPNHFTLSSILKCCVGSSDCVIGKAVHGWIQRNGIHLDVVLQNSIIELYAKTSNIEYAEKVFDLMEERDALSWNIMIHAYSKHGDTLKSMELFRKSPNIDTSSWNTIINGHIQSELPIGALELLYSMASAGASFNHFTFSIALSLAATLRLVGLGKQIHAKILRIGYDCDEFVMNALIEMYCKCRKMEASSAIFCKVSESNDHSEAKSILWSSMVAGYVQNGMAVDALELFRIMIHRGLRVDLFTLTSTVAACSDAGILEQGRQVHACAEKLGHDHDIFLASAIIDMYAKCGNLVESRKAFDNKSIHNVATWTSVIGSYSLFGKGKEAVQLFHAMLEENIEPNEITFVAILSACSHSGLVEEGYEHFRSMQEDYEIVPSIEHLTCMVDLLGRAGLLYRAKDFIYENNIDGLSVAWKVLLSACRTQNDVSMAIYAREQLVQIDSNDVGSHVLLSNIYAATRNWVGSYQLRKSMQTIGVMKNPGLSWIQIKNRVHTFVAGDRSHPEADEIFAYLESLISKLKELGYSVRTDQVMHDLEEEQRESVVSFHSEKLAIAYGIISTPCGSPLRVMKNLRICVDCHAAIKYITLVSGREIFVRDVRRFHHFMKGKCSCGDYW